MPRSTDGSCKTIFKFYLPLLLLLSTAPACYAKNIQDILKPTKNTFDWLDRLDALETLENNAETQQFDKQNLHNPTPSTKSVYWLKEKTKALRSFTRVQITDQFTVKPGKVKSKPLKLSDLSEYYDVEAVGEQNEYAKAQRAYGLKFNYDFK